MVTIEAAFLDTLSEDKGATLSFVEVVFDSASKEPGSGPFQRIRMFPVTHLATPGYRAGVVRTDYLTSDGNVTSDGNLVWTKHENDGEDAWLKHSKVTAIYSKIDGFVLPYAWQLNMELPLATAPNSGLVLPTTGVFKLYIDVFRVVPDSNWNEIFQETGVAYCSPNPQITQAPWGTATIEGNRQNCSLSTSR
jgi:hypothetical protein